MARSSRWPAAACLTLLAATAAVPGVDLCEGCWEVSGRIAYLLPSAEAGLEAAGGLGAAGAFRFRPYWSVEFALERYIGSIPDGPDDTLTFLSAAFTYTFRAAREQRTRVGAFLLLGYIWDHVGPGRLQVPTDVGPITAVSPPASDGGVAWGLGIGASTSLGPRTFLRYELRGVEWASFGIGQEAIALSVAVAFRLGE